MAQKRKVNKTKNKTNKPNFEPKILRHKNNVKIIG